MRGMLRFLLWLVLLPLALAVLAGFAGALHPAGDSFAVFRLPLAGAAAVPAIVLAALGSRRALAILALVLVLAAPAAWSYRPAEVAPGPFAIYQKNLNFRSGDLEAIAADILASGADIVALQEVSERNLAILDLLRVAYPTEARCAFRAVGETIVLARWPQADATVCGAGMTALRLETPAGPLWAVSLHLHWPWPYGQRPQVDALLPTLEGLAQPVVVAGDFNMVPWSASVHDIARATGTRRAGQTVTTFARAGNFAHLPIDHVLLPEGWTGALELRPELGSDHRGVLVHFGALD